ncbi:MAG: DJ-1/PfpI family protein [Cyclobacteriaceae bacterium]
MKNMLFLSLLLLSIPVWGQSANSAATAYYCPPCNRACDRISHAEAGTCAHCGMPLVQQTTKEHTLAMKNDRVTIAFYLQDGVEVLDFAGPMEVFSYAGFEVFTVSKTKDPIISQGILTIIPDYTLEDAPEANILAFFGGNASRAAEDEALIQWIQRRKSTTDLHFSVCTGAFMLGQAGLLDGQTATTFHNSIDDLQRSFPKANVRSDVRFVDNGTVITTAGISAGIDGALHLVAKLKGAAAAEEVVHYMEYDNWVPDQGLVMEK